MNKAKVLPICCLLLSFMKTTTSSSLDSIVPGQSIREDGTLVSASSTFDLGFFSPGTSSSSKSLYVGIWYKNSPSAVVWVANREAPLNNTTSGVLQVNDEGVLLLLLLNGTNNSTLWSSSNNLSSSKAVENPIAQLLDSGNLVVRNGQPSDDDDDNILWQSFDHPCDTLLPGMKLGWNLVTGLDRFLSSWRSVDNPGEGDNTVKIVLQGYPQAVQMKGNVVKARSGHWNGLTFTGYPAQKPNPIYRYEFVFNEKEAYYEYELLNRSVLSRYVISSSGVGQRFVWTSQTNSWEIVSTAIADQCENYALCGAYSICNVSNNPVCACLKGFVPKHQEEWNVSYWSNGCIRSIPLDCNKSNNDGFMAYTGVKLPDTSSSWYSKTMDLVECKKSCLQNCSCTAYASLDIRVGGSGCLLWFDGLIDIRQFSQGGQDLYIRVPASELDYANHDHGKFTKKMLVGIAAGSTTLVTGLIILGCTSIMKKKLENSVVGRMFHWKQYKNRLRKEDMDLPTFDLSVIVKVTDNFSSINKLGEGGFGPVYKGTLIDGQEVAIKMNSKKSDQGLEEFKNEVVLIAKLQHRNLVKLLGCCIQREEKMLIYEFMPNKSLDYFIFGESRSKLLDWLQRYRIIGGVARGLLYLHQDSRLRIIHRDLKTSNILLDSYMNPKISDFGLARTFREDQIEDNTKKVVGTHGYMPPEYAVHGHYSVKSDIFSFGVMVLEIVSGKKNRGFSDPEKCLNLLGHAWRLWTEDRPLEMIDKQLSQSSKFCEVKRCIHVGLLCVQQKPQDRPDISSVVLMLNGEKLLPQPKAPGFYTGSDLPEAESSSRIHNLFTPNEMSLTIFEAR